MFIVQSNGFHDSFLKMYHVHYYVRISSLFMDIESSIVFAYHLSFISSHIGGHQGLKLAVRTCALPITAEQASLLCVFLRAVKLGHTPALFTIWRVALCRLHSEVSPVQEDGWNWKHHTKQNTLKSESLVWHVFCYIQSLDLHTHIRTHIQIT